MRVLIPQGCGKTPVRIQRCARAAAAVAEALALEDTIEQEETVLVVVDAVDPSEMPRTWGSVDLLKANMGDQMCSVGAEDDEDSGAPDGDEESGTKM